MAQAIVVVLFVGAACTRPPANAPRTPVAEKVFVGTIVGEGPLGDGSCVQKSYEVQPEDPRRAKLWIHFERCGDGGPSPPTIGLDGLAVGSTWRFTVRRGASRNFGNAPILLAAEPR